MIISVDEVIPYAQAAFAGAGEIRLFAGRSVRPGDVRDAEALIVRSVTRVDAHLLEGSSVRFVGTASIGMDHLDLEYLQARRIHVANAAGSNANSVAEYVVSGLLAASERHGWDLSRKSLGVIGAGRIGSLVAAKAAALGMTALLCDPPLRESTGEARYGFLEDVLDADILTLHVPLTASGPYPTEHMIGQRLLQSLSRRQWLINSSRGAVVCGPDLKRALQEKRLGGAILDVWEGEPEIDPELLAGIEMGTPHVAGSSLDGKARATAMILEELCRCFGTTPRWESRSVFPPLERVSPRSGARGEPAVWSVVQQAYDIRRDDAELKKNLSLPREAAAKQFDRLRNGYALRPEFSHYTVEAAGDASLAETCSALGFAVSRFPDNPEMR